MDKIILVNKEKGYTSFDIVRKLKSVLHTKKVGHCGTLDPLATGLLVIVSGKYTKAARFIENGYKEYEFEITLGKNSLTYDLEGPFDKEKEINYIDKEKINEVLKKFRGKIKQTPPIYSAISKNGKRLYEYARENKEVEIESREVEIKELELLDFNDTTIRLRTLCSKGTYVRSLGVDIAFSLNNLGYISYLNRTKIGNLNLNDSSTLEEIEQGNYRDFNLYDVINGYEFLELDEKMINDIKMGRKVLLEDKRELILVNKEKEVIAYYNNGKIERGLF